MSIHLLAMAMGENGIDSEHIIIHTEANLCHSETSTMTVM